MDAAEDWSIRGNIEECWVVTGIRGIFTVREQLIGKRNQDSKKKSTQSIQIQTLALNRATDLHTGRDSPSLEEPSCQLGMMEAAAATLPPVSGASSSSVDGGGGEESSEKRGTERGQRRGRVATHVKTAS